MARVISFIDRKLVLGNAAAVGEAYSQVYEVTDAAKIDLQLRVFGTTNTGVGGALIAALQHTSDPTFVNWLQHGTSITGQGTGVFNTTLSGLLRFARAKVTVPAGVQATALLVGTARQS